MRKVSVFLNSSWKYGRTQNGGLSYGSTKRVAYFLIKIVMTKEIKKSFPYFNAISRSYFKSFFSSWHFMEEGIVFHYSHIHTFALKLFRQQYFKILGRIIYNYLGIIIKVNMIYWYKHQVIMILRSLFLFFFAWKCFQPKVKTFIHWPNLN